MNCPIWPFKLLDAAFSPSTGIVPRAIDSFIHNFSFWRHIATTGMGLKELLFDTPAAPPHQIHVIKTIRDPIVWVIKTIWHSHHSSREFYTVHGALFFTSGLSGLWGLCFQQLAATAISEGAFVLANLVALKYNITLYLHTHNPTEIKSAILGILSTTGYIVSHAMLMIGFHATIAFVVCCLALTIGGIKILYDILYHQNQVQPA